MVVKTVYWTIRDLDAMPDDGGWQRYEIIDGDLYVTRAPHIGHQDAAGNIYFHLNAWSRQTQLGKAFLTPGVIFSPTDAVIPDVVWMSGDRLATSVDESGYLTVAPQLIVEILSPGERNEQRDKEVKRKLYSVHGVGEYWIVSWQLKTIVVYRRQDAQLQIYSTLDTADTLSSPLLPGLSLPIARIFS